MGFSALISDKLSRTPRYQALNRLVLRSVFLALEAFRDDPCSLFLLENVVRITTRGRGLLDQVIALLNSYGYATAETTHDCGELGALAQSRKRFLLVARNVAKVPSFLYEPPKHALRGVGEVLSKLPMPLDPRGGVMHRLPRLGWKTWARLAFVEAGSDWRSLSRLAVKDGQLSDYVLCPVPVAPGRSDGAFSVADLRFKGDGYGCYGVRAWDQPATTITSQRSPAQGAFSVADPRPPAQASFSKYLVTPWNGGTVIGGRDTGAFAVTDPRPGFRREPGDAYLTAGHYGVVGWSQPSFAVTGSACHDNGRFSVADPRIEIPIPGAAPAQQGLPGDDQKLITMIISSDRTWHRPFTTLELACIQGLIDADHIHDLEGDSDSAKRTRIGNSVPPDAASAIASTMAQTLLLAWSGETFALSNTPIWVRGVAVALSVDQPCLM